MDMAMIEVWWLIIDDFWLPKVFKALPWFEHVEPAGHWARGHRVSAACMVVDKRVFLEGAMSKLVTETSLMVFDNRGRIETEEG